MFENLKKIDNDENNMRVDRWFKTHYPDLSFVQLQKLLRTGQIRVNSKRVKLDTRLQAEQKVRLPPMLLGATSIVSSAKSKDVEFLKNITLYEDDKILILNKPIGLAVQGGSGITRHIDGMLESLRTKKGVKPRLVHRLDRDTTGVIAIAKTRLAANFLAKAFKDREVEKKYWSLVVGVPRKREDKISTWLVKHTSEQGDIMKICAHKSSDAMHAISYYKVLETIAQKFSWLEMSPHTGRTHQLRVHAAHIEHPILGDPKYFYADSNWIFPGGLQNKLHLHAREIILPHPNGSKITISAPLPPHMVQSFKVLGFDESLYKL